MKKKIRFFIAVIVSILICCFIIFACDKKNNYCMQTLIEQEMTYKQYDSLCVKDNISLQFEDWDNTFFINSEKKVIEQFMYTVYKSDTIILYTAIPNTNTVFMTKRIQYVE